LVCWGCYLVQTSIIEPVKMFMIILVIACPIVGNVSCRPSTGLSIIGSTKKAIP